MADNNVSHKNWLKIIVIGGVIVAILVVAVGAFSMGRLTANPASTPTITATPSTDNSWSQVQSSGVLRVGTAADNPPFTYLNENYAISGFDPELIRLIGQRLGVRVEITDFAFNGLLGALRVNQVDAVIAALSRNPQREALADFSNVYYNGEEGVLARTDSKIEKIITLDQFKGQRVGVQRLSVYEKWLREELVDTGKLPAEKLFIYAKPEHAVRDLSMGLLDVVVLDDQNAALLSSTSGVRYVKSGLYPQRFAIAMNLGATELQTRINQALTELENDGTLNNLRQTHLGIVPDKNNPTAVPPTAVPPTATPKPEEACVDAMIFIKDLNFDDQGLTYFYDFLPNEPFQKGWRIKNNGTCPWTVSFSARFVYGTTNQSDMRGQPTALNRVVAPGETYDLFVNLIAPDSNAPGQHVGYWQMFNSDGRAFGQTIWVAINVIDTSAPQPTKTPTAQPTKAPTAQPTVTSVPKPTPIPDPAAPIKNKNWYLSKYDNGKDLVKPLIGSKAYIYLDTNNELTGNTGCNKITGRYLIDNKYISITEVNSGMMYCQTSEGVMAQEGSIVELLQYANGWRLYDDNLELLRNDKVILVFTEKQPR